MTSHLDLRVISRSELQSGSLPDWDDPFAVAQTDALKIKTLTSNPFSQPGDPVQIVAVQEKRVLGRIDVLAGLLNIKGQPERVLYGSALYVPPEFRHQGIGLMLLLELQNLHRTVAVCGASQLALPVYERLKWTRFQMPRQMLVRSSRAVLETKLSNRFLLGLGRRVVDTALTFQRALTMKFSKRRDVVVREIQRVPAAWNELLTPRDKVSAVRSSEWYAWLLENRFNPDATLKRRLYVIEDRQGHALGFFLTKAHRFESASRFQLKNIAIGSLQDWMIFEPERLTVLELVYEAVADLLREKVDAIEIVSTDPALQRQLRWRGFFGAGCLDFLFRAKADSPLANPALRDANEWLLRAAYSDNFFA